MVVAAALPRFIANSAELPSVKAEVDGPRRKVDAQATTPKIIRIAGQKKLR